MHKEGNSFQIVLTPPTKKETYKKLPAKRKPPKETKGELSKRGKYERRSIRNTSHDNGLLLMNDFGYQTNIYAIQSKFIEDIGIANQPLLQALSNAYGYSENLNIIRTRLRKENARNHLKKSLSRTPFNQNQQFTGTMYKPGQAFIKNQNSINRQGETNKASIKTAELNQDIENIGTFICEGCKRSDVKKYAKNLCQTCYKRKKKYIEGIEEQRTTTTPEIIPRINEKPESLPIPNKEWTGVCPDCKK